MKKLLRFLKFWECWCFEVQGDNSECPKHALPPALVRISVVLGIIFLIVIIPTFFK